MRSPSLRSAATLAGSLLLACSAASAQTNPEREAYFGQTHSHTSWSVDAYLIGNHVTTPEDAYKYSMGLPVKHPSGHEVQLKGRPLDFHGVTDHSEYAGVISLANDPTSEISKQPIAARLRAKTPAEVNAVFQWIAGSLARHEPIKELVSPEIAGTVWKKVIEIADKYNQPGKFTTFVAYEWTSAPNFRNMHRNVFFRSSKNVPMPFTAIDSQQAEDLWTWMDTQRKNGTELFSISHNANLSDGLMFPLEVDGKGRPIDAAWAQQRLNNEPLTEIHQVKGSSETHPDLSPNDEFANYEIMNFLIGVPNSTSSLNGSYIRQAYENGLAMQEKRGYNPYKMGVVGASDSHNTVVPYSQANNFGSHGFADATPQARLAGAVESGMAVLKTSVSGLGGVWAESNTREAIFDAMKRKEVFGTSGVRIKVRLFGGWGYGADALSAKDWGKAAYAKGVPMGGDLPTMTGKAPTFLVWAVKDPDDANLDRIQIIKGWTKQGQIFEKVYDVAWAGNRKIEPVTGKLPAVGSTVDIAKATYTNAIGAVELKTVWTDPEFDPSLHSFYYARVLQIPTPRWSTYDAAKLGVPPPPQVASTVQERAWTSPIWYSPAPGAPKAAALGLTVTALKARGAVALDDAALTALLANKATWWRNRVTGETLEHAAGFTVANGRIHGGSLGEATVYRTAGRHIAARRDEFGYANYELMTRPPQRFAAFRRVAK